MNSGESGTMGISVCGRRFARLVCAWLVLACCTWVSAREPEGKLPGLPLFQMLDSGNGLPSNHTRALVQDHDGLLWIGTRDGLASYDGVAFHIHRHDPADATSLPGNSVQALHVDAENRLWVAIEGGGLSVLDSKRKTWRHLRASTDARFMVEDVFAFESASDGAIWFGGYDSGLYRYDVARDALERFGGELFNGDRHVLMLAAAGDGRVLAGTTQGLLSADASGIVPVRVDAEELHNEPVYDIDIDAAGRMWISAAGGLFEVVDGVAHRQALPEGALAGGVIAMMGSRDGARWVATRNALGLDVGDGWRELRGQGIPVQAGRMQAMLEDREGGLWFATTQSGLAHLAPGWRDFSVLEASHQGGLPGVAADLSQSPDGALWIAGSTGWLVRVDSSGATAIEDANGQWPSHLRSIAALPDGTLLLGHHNGIVRYAPATHSFSPWPQASHVPVAKGGVHLLRLVGSGPDAELWIYVYGIGLERRSLDGELLARFGESEGLANTTVENIVRDSQGALWLATASGAKYLASGVFVKAPGIAKGAVYGLDFASDGTLWVLGFGEVSHYRFDGERWQREAVFTAPDGPPAVEGGGLIVDASGDVFAATLRGLYRFRSADGHWRHYGRRDGLPSGEFGLLPPLRLRNGGIAAATLGGVVVFHPGHLSEPVQTPELRIVRMSVRRNGRVLELAPGEPLRLRHDDRELSIIARLASLSDPTSNRYRFRLAGYEIQWVQALYDGERTFSQLPPGRFELSIVGANATGAWSEPVRIEVEVSPPWWRTALALMAFALLFLLLLAWLAWLWRQRLARAHRLELIERQREWAEQASQAKSAFLATMGHEIRTPMTGVLGMAELMARDGLPPAQHQRAQAILDSGRLMLRLLDDALELARIEAGKLQLSHEIIDPRALLQQVRELLAPLAQRKGLALRVNVDESLPHALMGDPHRIAQIVLNLGNNAIKFTGQGEVRVSARNADGGIELAVCDTGPGMDEATRSRVLRRFEQAEGESTARRHGGAGLGLAICEELARAMQGRIEIESVPGQGSTFRVWLPLETAEPSLEPFVQPAAEETVAGKNLLLVEDDETAATAIAGLLQSLGHRVTCAPQALAALTELGAARFDLALVDLDLPGMDGLELAQLACGLPDAPPLVAITANADPDAPARAATAGMSGFARKPLNAAALAELVARFAR